ncbi:cationic amino acid transporter 2 [Macrosteles quadrilineatus]|uniref:cationic amino acid transporter 2 n=1 Tax=Macrosteles quadrilineatus TaxID=74068 RepID=UPI0023E34B1B|nr:cationic amino acid transporter 2 [Macrosteles quadrilineatus]
MKLPNLNPGLFPTGDYRKDGLNLFAKFIRTKNMESMQEEPVSKTKKTKDGKLKLTKCLTTLDLTSLGVGSCVGTGMYLVAGMVAHNVAGPGVVISFIIAAVASIFSGACYAEFGVRVPHTTGSAYMYSYVTVGELIAFVIGWNMILEYLIGTSACACALSACFDALTNGQISKTIASDVGTFFGRPPDVLAFIITLLMMVLLAAGVKKSLIFNNILNAVNMSAWVFLMTAGLFYVDTSNWTQHKGFLPFGWSGVFTGAATCFYAFIGFDIIATTGEEANNPKKSIPLAIVTSLAIILTAYVTCSMMLTLIVPYEQVDPDAALVEMFGQVQAYKCKYVLAIGALAGLTVSMFGSMFPMPRIVYAMAQDGLIFKQLSAVLPVTGTPVIATFSSGVAAAFAALIIRLEVLVEMMSIGTLLAYTLVSTCVLILRYQPHSTNLIELLPESLRTPIKQSPTKENLSNGQVTYGNQLAPDMLRNALGSVTQPPPPIPGPPSSQRIMVRRVTRSSPDSDDTFPGEESEEVSMRDDQFLVADRSENKFYGTVRGGSTPAGAGPSLGNIGRRLQAATYLCPAIFPWVDTGPATEESGMFVMKMVGLLYILIFIFDLTIVLGMGSDSSIVTYIILILLAAIIAVLLVISRKPQNRKTLMFMTPGLPFVPAIAIMVNIYLIFKLSILTLVRFTVWMVIGFGVYFYYGIKHSTLEDEDDSQNIELSVTTEVPQHHTAPPQPSPDPYVQSWDPAPAFNLPPGTLPAPAAPSSTKPSPAASAPAPASTGSSLNVQARNPLFVSTSQFPKWDD